MTQQRGRDTTWGDRGWLDPAAPERFVPWALGVIALMALGLRVMELAHFPDIQADEGLWTHTTKNRVLFGDWFLDGRGHLFLSPVFHGLSLPAFVLLGPSIEAARLVSALAGVGSVLLVYLLALRLTGSTAVSLLAALLMALDPWAVITSRQAMTESVLLFFVLASGVLVLGDRRRDVLAAGACLALAVLTKLSAAPMGAAFAGYLLLRGPHSASDGERDVAGWRRPLEDAFLYGVVALGLAAFGYWAVSRIDPSRFVDVFARELGGGHVGSGREAGSILGRVGLDPVLAGRSVFEVIRSNPYLFCIGSMGALVAIGDGSRARLALVPWVVVAMGFPLTQVYQPVRYFIPVLPALVVLAALLLVRLAEGSADRVRARRVLAGTAGLVLAFNMAYLATNYLANRGSRAVEVAAWVGAHTSPDEALLVAAHFATDVPNRAYSHDLVLPELDALEETLGRLDIRYVIWDEAQWTAEARTRLEAALTEVHRWPFGAVYRVD